MSEYRLIKNGRLIDGHRDQIGDLWIRDGKFVDPPAADQRPEWQFDATGRVVMPGGVDMHSHFVGPKVNAGRQLTTRTSLGQQAVGSVVPDLRATELMYAGLGYTTAFDAAVPPAFSQMAQLEIAQLSLIDAGFFVMAGNHSTMLNAVAAEDEDRVHQFAEHLFAASGAHAIKIVNPGGVDDWKAGRREPTTSIDRTLVDHKTTPRAILRMLSQANDRLKRPHAIHIHCNQLGLPGNWQTTLETMKALGDQRGHLAHIQFHSYRDADDEASFGSAVPPLADYLNKHENLSVDVGQIMFGKTVSMTGDSVLGYYLQQISGKPWVSHDTGGETGCGISPIEYRHKNRIHGLQWAIGLEWMLSVTNPWQLALSTDHPNGASFLVYPQIIELLMRPELRRQKIESLHDDVRHHSNLYDMNRAYTLQEIAITTRSAPAKLLGLENKGSLQVGADADLTIYNLNDDICQMFQFPRLVMKDGRVTIDDGQLSKLQMLSV